MLHDHVTGLFARQYGVAANVQLAPLTPPERRRILRHPDIERLTPRVIEHRAAPLLPERALIAAVFDGGSGSALWGKSASSLWGFARHRCVRPHVGRQRTRLRGERLGQMHLVGDLDPADVTTHREIPVTRPEPTILWLAGALTHRFDAEVAATRIGTVIDQAWRQRLIDGPYLHRLVETSGGRGRSGIVAMRLALETRPPDYRPAGSRLEERFEAIVPRSVARQLRRQVTVDAEVVERTVDFRLDRWPLLVEINGEAWHTSISDREADDERYARLLSLGFSIVVFWEFDIWHQADLVRQTMLHLAMRPDTHPTLHRPTAAPWLAGLPQSRFL